VLREIVRPGLLDLHRLELAGDALEVDVAVARHADDEPPPSSWCSWCTSRSRCSASSSGDHDAAYCA